MMYIIDDESPYAVLNTYFSSANVHGLLFTIGVHHNSTYWWIVDCTNVWPIAIDQGIDLYPDYLAAIHAKPVWCLCIYTLFTF